MHAVYLFEVLGINLFEELGIMIIVVEFNSTLDVLGLD